MLIEVTTHNEILKDPIVEIGEPTLDNALRQTFVPLIILVDKNDTRRRFAQYLPEQPYVNGTWTDEDVKSAIENYLKEISKD